MENRAPKVSLIMPAYNAQNDIERSVRSVLDQTFRDIELIVINDGSKDNTEKILLEMAKEDPRLRPITTQNGGPAVARNRGLDAVTPGAEYVMFVDADDQLLPDALEYALEGAKSGADLTIFGFTVVCVDGSQSHYCEPEEFLTPAQLKEAFPRLYKANILNGAVTKLYKVALLQEHGIRFRDYRWGEDRMFVFEYLQKSHSIQVLPQCKYLYMMHQGESLISSFYDKKVQVCLESDRQVEELCRTFGVTDDNVCKYMFAKSIFSCITNLFTPSCKLNAPPRREYVRAIAREEQVRRRFQNIHMGIPTTVLCKVILTGQPWLILPTFWFVTWVGKTAPALFVKIKHKK